MADAVTTQIVEDGHKRAIVMLTNVSDATGESGVVKVDPATLSAGPSRRACTGVRIRRVFYDVSGMHVLLLWDATTAVTALVLSDAADHFDFSEFGGLPNNSGTGKTGKLLLTTGGQTSGATYTIGLDLVKVYD